MPRLHNSLRVTFTYVFVSVPLQLIMALGVALLLDKGMRGLALYRSIFYLPSMLGGSVAIALLWRQMFGTDGMVNQVLRLFGIDATTGWIADPQVRPGHADPAAHLDLRFADGDLPGRVATDPGHVLRGRLDRRGDADGRSSSRSPCRCCPRSSSSTWYLQIIGAFQSFTQAFVVSNGTGGPSDSTMQYTLYLYQRGFGQFQMGYAAAMAWLLVVIVGVLTAINFFASKYWVFYDD